MLQIVSLDVFYESGSNTQPSGFKIARNILPNAFLRWVAQDPFHLHGLPEIYIWIGNHVDYFLCDVIIHLTSMAI